MARKRSTRKPTLRPFREEAPPPVPRCRARRPDGSACDRPLTSMELVSYGGRCEDCWADVFAPLTEILDGPRALTTREGDQGR